MVGTELNYLQVDDKMKAALFGLETKMLFDFDQFLRNLPVGNHSAESREEQSKKYIKGIAYEIGYKYIKVICNNLNNGSSHVHSFINLTNENFNYGDILKAEGFNKPAVNKARGNIFEHYRITHTGALYLTARNTKCITA